MDPTFMMITEVKQEIVVWLNEYIYFLKFLM